MRGMAGTRRTLTKVALRSALCSELRLVDGNAPTHIELFPPGPKLVGLDGRQWQLPDPAALVARARKHPLQLPVDLEHATHIKGPKGEPAPAYAWMVDYEVGPRGEVLAEVAWNAAGRELVVSGAVKYVSPAFRFDNDNNVISIESAGLTTKPNFVMAALNSEGQEETMNEIRKLLGLPDDADEAAVMAAITKLVDAAKQVEAAAETAADALPETAPEVVTARNKAPSLDLYVPRTDYDALVARARAADERIARIERDAREREINRLLDDATGAGKISPSTRDYYLAACREAGGIERFREFVAQAPVILAPSSKLDGRPTPKQSDALTADELAVCRASGITPEEYRAARR